MLDPGGKSGIDPAECLKVRGGHILKTGPPRESDRTSNATLPTGFAKPTRWNWGASSANWMPRVPEFVRNAVLDYQDNKGTRGWDFPDRNRGSDLKRGDFAGWAG